MAINFPISLDSLVNPEEGDTQESVSHKLQHSNVNDAIEAIQAKLGIDESADSDSVDYKLNGPLQTFTPVWTGIVTPTGQNVGRFWKIGGLCAVRIFGNWSAGTTPSATVTLQLPHDSAYAGLSVAGNAFWRDNGGVYSPSTPWLTAVDQATLLSSTYAYVPNTGHSVREIELFCIYIGA